MKQFAILFSLISLIYANDLEYKTNFSTKYINYRDFDNNVQISGKTNIKYNTDIYEIISELKYLYSSKYDQNRYLDINELYVVKEFDNSKFEFGKLIKYWGELEGYNLTDIFNQKDYMNNPFDKFMKNGAFNINYTKYLNNDSLEVGMKLYEDDKKFPQSFTPYSISSLNYNKTIQSESSRYNSSIYLKYNYITDGIFESDNKFILWHGYDNKRYFRPINETTISQYAYKVNKLLFFSNIVYKDIIFKLEAAYTDVIEDKQISDYIQVGVGAEFESFNIKKNEISIYTEYYNYHYKDKQGIKNIDMGEIYDDDLFIAFIINFNDTKRSELKSGVLYDFGTDEKIFKTNFKSSISDTIVLKAEYLKTISNDTDTLLGSLNNDSRNTLSLTYIF